MRRIRKHCGILFLLLLGGFSLYGQIPCFTCLNIPIDRQIDLVVKPATIASLIGETVFKVKQSKTLDKMEFNMRRQIAYMKNDKTESAFGIAVMMKSYANIKKIEKEIKDDLKWLKKNPFMIPAMIRHNEELKSQTAKLKGVRKDALLIGVSLAPLKVPITGGNGYNKTAVTKILKRMKKINSRLLQIRLETSDYRELNRRIKLEMKS